MKLFYRHRPERKLIPYHAPDGTPVPRVGEIVEFKRDTAEGGAVVDSFRVAQVFYRHGIYTDDPVHVDVDLDPITSYD
jgi:hypothetical protein